MISRVSILFALLVACAGTGVAQVSFRVPVTITAGSVSDTLFLGVNSGNTVGIDDNASFGEFTEAQAPPLPPPPFPFDARFVSLPGRVSTFPTGLGTGSYSDYRGFVSATQVDSFRIRIDGEATDNGDVVISWPTTLKNYATSWTIKPYVGSDWPTTDMLKATTVTIPAGGQKSIIIIKSGAFVTDARGATAAGEFALGQNYPNPFNPSTTIAFSLARQERATLEVFSLLGARVATVVDGVLSAGTHRVHFDASALPSGVYFYRVRSASATAMRRMILAR